MSLIPYVDEYIHSTRAYVTFSRLVFLAMDCRCDVETLEEFGLTGPSVSPRMTCCGEADVLTCTADDEVYVYSKKERRVKASDFICRLLITNLHIDHSAEAQ